MSAPNWRLGVLKIAPKEEWKLKTCSAVSRAQRMDVPGDNSLASMHKVLAEGVDNCTTFGQWIREQSSW